MNDERIIIFRLFRTIDIISISLIVIIYRLHLVLGDVGGGVGDDAGNGDNDTGLGVDAGNTAYDIFKRTICDADHASRTIVDFLVGDRIGLGHTHIDEMNKVGHIIVGNCDGSIGSGELRLLGDFRLVYELEGGVFYDGVDIVVATVGKEEVGL